MQTTMRRAVRVARTARRIQLAGKFDLPVEDEVVREWAVDVALPDEWSVGVIVGPSMAGKTTLAQELFPGELVEQGHWPWPADKCVADGFPKGLSIDEIAGLLSSVGFSSPPDWMKPYGALSNGGKFRVDLARTLAERPKLAVVDEFGSLVHREARQVAAAAAAKAVRRRGGRLVALCVHDDAVEYFEPDWVVEIVPGQPVRLKAVRGLVRRPAIELDVAVVPASAWELFREHHYLSGELHPAATCFGGFIGGRPVAFTAVLPFPHAHRPGWREHRTVCEPTFQGIGIGNRMSELVASVMAGTGKPYFSNTSHPAMIRHRVRSPLWRMTMKPGLRTAHTGGAGGTVKMGAAGATSRLTAGFEYVGPAMEPARAAEVLRRAALGRDSMEAVRDALRRRPGATASQVTRETGLSSTQVRLNLADLVAAGEARKAGTPARFWLTRVES